MRVEKLSLSNFRNIEHSELEPSPRLNFLVGPNGQGKTSFLEALSFLGTLRSFRSTRFQEVIRWHQPHAEVKCVISALEDLPERPEDDWNAELKVVFDTSKTAFVNGKPYRSSTQYLSQRFGAYELGFHAVVFNPSDHDLIRGEPSLRRSYLDRVIAAENIDYLKHFQKYRRLLEQRNAVLKDYWQRPAQGKDLLIGFTEPLAQHAAYIALERLKWIIGAREGLENATRKIAPRQPDCELIYHSSWIPEIESFFNTNKDLIQVDFAGQPSLPSLELLEQGFWNHVALLESAEWRAGHTLVGPHRDDWSFRMGDQNLRGHGSQGEVRTALLALKLTEIDLFRKRTGHRPVFLLDDFSSELDRDRRAFLLRFLSETDLQVFVTTTEESLSLGKRYWVSNGGLAVVEK